jgi:hypothetical protein
MKAFIKISHLIFLGMITVVVSSCSAIYGGATNTGGDESISAAPTALDFSGSVGDTSYRSLTFTNRTTGNYLINNLALVDNVCGDFSVYNVMDSSGNILYSFGDSIAVSVAAGQSVSINLKFSPSECNTAEYTAILAIYYQTDAGQTHQTAELHAVVDQPTASGNSTLDCPVATVTNTYYDGLEDPTVPRSLPAGTYYLRIDRIRSYIQPTAGFATYALKVGTDISLDQIPDENEFQPIYLPLTSDGVNTITMQDVTECSGFKLPTPVTDTFLRGSTPVLSITALDGSGSSSGEVVSGDITFNDVNAFMYAHIGNSQSLIQDETTGDFAVSIQMDLTTGETEIDPVIGNYLAEVASQIDDEGEPFLNISADGENSTMQGQALRHGTVRLVGVGVFTGSGFVGSQIAHQAMIENQAYLFIQIDGLVTTLKESTPIDE